MNILSLYFLVADQTSEAVLDLDLKLRPLFTTVLSIPDRFYRFPMYATKNGIPMWSTNLYLVGCSRITK